VFAAIALVVGLYPVLPLAIGDFGGGYDAFLDRQGVLSTSDITAGCGGKRPTESADSGAGGCEAAEGRVTIATGNTGGVYYTLGGGLAQLISDETPIKASAAETGASVQNIQQLVAGDYDIAFALADSAADAVEGKGSFEGEKQDITTLARIYQNYTQVVVRADSGISTIADMKGKKISTGSPKSGTEVIANRLLKAAGLDPASDVSAQRLAFAPDRGPDEVGPDRRVRVVGRPADAGGHRPDDVDEGRCEVRGHHASVAESAGDQHGVREGHAARGHLRAALGRAVGRGAEPAAGAQRLPRRRRVRDHQAGLRQRRTSW